MKLNKKANKLTISRKEWESIGKTAGWQTELERVTELTRNNEECLNDKMKTLRDNITKYIKVKNKLMAAEAKATGERQEALRSGLIRIRRAIKNNLNKYRQLVKFQRTNLGVPLEENFLLDKPLEVIGDEELEAFLNMEDIREERTEEGLVGGVDPYPFEVRDELERENEQNFKKIKEILGDAK